MNVVEWCKYKLDPKCKAASLSSIGSNVIDSFEMLLRWLDWIFWGWYLPSLSINYVGMSKDMEKKVTTTVLYKDENFLWSGFYCNRSRHGNVMMPLRFSFIAVFLCTMSFFEEIA